MQICHAHQIIAASVFGVASIAGCDRTSDTPIGKPDGDSSATVRPKDNAKSSRVVTPVRKSKTASPKWDPNGIRDFQLIERSGRQITRADLLGKPFVASFIFTSCRGPCANITKEMFDLQEWLKTRKIDVRLVTLSVDPKRDTPEVLKRYAEVMGADGDRWWFLTGEKDAIYSLIRESFVAMVREIDAAQRLPGFEIAHTTGLMLVNKNGLVIGEYNAKYPQPMNALRRRLSEWKRTGKFPPPENKKKSNAASTKKRALKTPETEGNRAQSR